MKVKAYNVPDDSQQASEKVAKEASKLSNEKAISGRKQTEQALRESDVKYRTLVERLQEGVYQSDVESNFVTLNNTGARILGFDSPGQVLGKYKTTSFCYDLSEGAQIIEETKRFGSLTREVRVKRRDGTLIWILVNTNIRLDENGNIVGYGGVFSDITERKQAVANLRNIITSSTDGIVVVDQDGLIRFVNPAFESLVGREAEDLVGSLFGFPIVSETAELEIARSSREVATVEMRLVEISWEGKDAHLALLRDITERKKAEQKALVTAKLASIGELVAGVAHEINNPLTAILGYAQLLAEKQDVPQSVREDLQKIYEESQRTVKIVQNLLRFARHYKPGKSLVSINELLGQTLDLRNYELIMHNITLTTKLAADLPFILADYNQLQQVILNIITNAQHAIAETKHKGKITVTTYAVKQCVRISVSDNGSGIAPENINRVFDPFFTTKPVGIGSGLGLSVCHGIIKEHGGNIYNESTLGKGTNFIIELPIATDEQAVLKREEPAKKKSRRPRQKD